MIRSADEAAKFVDPDEFRQTAAAIARSGKDDIACCTLL
jgi:hypothetical protein